MSRDKLGFAGEGWGAISAVRGLQKYFDLQCLTLDEAVISELSGDYSLITSFDEFNCDVIICAGYRPIINTEYISKYKIINIHYSRLPAYRGWHSTAWAIMNGEEMLGLSIFRMNQFIDDGPILHQKAFKNDHSSSATYYMNLMNLYIEDNLGDIVSQYNQGLLVPKAQDKKRASWTGKRGDAHNMIDFHKDFEYCKRLFRVLQWPYPRPHIKYRKNVYTVGKVAFHESSVNTDISRILNIDDEGVWVKSVDGYFILDDLRDDAGNIVNNNIFKIGSFTDA